ncbi:MAG: hypothetical protein ABI780_07835 [Ardenticatenales bacterium]
MAALLRDSIRQDTIRRGSIGYGSARWIITTFLIVAAGILLRARPNSVAAQSEALRLEWVGQGGGTVGALAVAGPYIYAGIGPRLDVVTPDEGIVGSSDVLSGIVRDLAIDGARAYAILADGDDGDDGSDHGGLAVLDVADPHLPRLVSEVAADAAYTAITAVPGYVIAGGSKGWQATTNVHRGVVDVIDVRVPDNPVRVARLLFEHAIDDVVVKGDIAYAIERRFNQSESTAIRAIDVRDPARPSKRAVTTVAGQPGQIFAASDGRLFLTGGQAGLRVLTSAPDGQVTSVGRVVGAGCADAVAVERDRVAVIDRCGDGHVRLYDASGGWPVEVDVTSVDVTATALAWQGDLLVVADGKAGKLHMYDTSGGVLNLRHDIWGLGSVTAIAAVDNGLVAVGSSRFSTLSTSDQGIVNVGGWTGSRNFFGAEGLAVAGHWAYVPTGDSKRVEAFDVSDLSVPVPRSGVDLGGIARAIAVTDGSEPAAFVATSSGPPAWRPRIAALSLAAPEAPRVIGGTDDVDANWLAVYERSLFALSNTGLSVLDVSVPAAPRLVGQTKELGFLAGQPFAMAAGATRVYVAGTEFLGCPSFDCSVLSVWDVNDPTQPNQIAAYSTGTDPSPSLLALDGDRLLAGGADGLQVLDAPALDRRLTVLARTTTPGTLHGIVVRPIDAVRRLLYAADGDGGLVVLRLVPATDPTASRPLQATALPSPVASAAPTATPLPPPTISPTPAPTAAPTFVRATSTSLPSGASHLFLPFTSCVRWRPAPPASMALVDGVGGPSRAVAWRGDAVYRGQGGRIHVFDATVVERIHEVARTAPLPGLLFGLRAAADRLYAAAGDAGLAVYDISTPLAPVLRARVPTGDAAYDVDVDGRLVAVAAGDAGLRLFDVVGDAPPQAMGDLELLYRATKVRLYRGFAYVTVADGALPIQVIDVRDPATPRRVSELHGEFETSSGSAIAFAADRAFVMTCANCLTSFSIADPTAPRLEQTWIDWFADALLAANDRLYLINGGVRVLDIGRPERPVERGFASLGFRAHNVAINGTRLAVVTGDGPGNVEDFGYMDAGPLLVLDAADVDQPRVSATVPYDADAYGQIMPTGHRDRLYLRSNPMEPHSGEGSDSSGAAHLAAPSYPVSVRLLDVSDPSHLRLVESVPALAGAVRLVVEGQTGYALSDDGEGVASLTVWDLADAALPHRLGGVTVDSLLGELVVARGTVYGLLGVWKDRVYVCSLLTIDVRDPANPRILARLELPEPAGSLAVAGTTVWLRAGDGLLRVDIREPAAPRWLDRIDVAGAPGGGGIVATEHDVWLTTWNGLVRVGADDPNVPAPILEARGRFSWLAPFAEGQLIATGDGAAVFDVRSGHARFVAAFDAPDYGPVSASGVAMPIVVGDLVFVYLGAGSSTSSPGPAALRFTP